MVEYENFIYLDVYRTGSTHLIGLLDKITEEKRVRIHRHSSLTWGRPSGYSGGKIVFATVRNPWDWYVSLWAHGTAGKSAIRRFLAPHYSAQEIDAFYDREESAESFRRWLRAMHDPVILANIMQELLPQSGLAPIIGLYSYRFLRVTTRFPLLFLRRGIIRQPLDAVTHLHRFRAFDEILRTETLTEDLMTFVKNHGGRCRFRPDAAEIILQAEQQHVNASPRRLSGYRNYFDAECSELVARRDCLFTEYFGYRF